MNQETQMVLLEHREYLRLKANSEKYLRTKNSSDSCTGCKNSSKKTSKIEDNSVTKEGFGEIKLAEQLPLNFLDKPDVFDGATPEQLEREAGTTSTKAPNSNMINAKSEVVSPDSSEVVKTDSSDIPWYYIGK